ncbi:S-layer homology domain-containing protein [Cohnella cellulosilytica]|uniref:S-layer homology domain-containing protein n=1 Tax=Cohnella cellulosilytica TaxID=986710 RepID=A0ABW2FC76_9BACL
MRIIGVLLVGLLMVAGGMPGKAGAAASETPFKDISKRHWARGQIENAASRGYVEGYPDGTFNAKASVTRAEFVKMTVEALRLPHSQGGFPWYQGYISAALEFGVLDETDSADYEKPIKRIEMMRIIARALAAETVYGEYLASFQSLKKGDMPFEDRQQFQNRDVPYIALAYGSGIVNGFPDRTMRIHSTATRAEAIVLMESFLEVRKLDPLSRERLLTFSSTGNTFEATKIEPMQEEQS